MIDTTIKSIATVFSFNAEELKLNSTLRRRQSIIREFALTTSTRGIPGIARSENIHNRIYWTISTTVFAGIMLYFVIESIKGYFSYPTQTSVTMNIESMQYFPAVSICNYSPVRFDTFIVPFVNYTNALNSTNTNDTSTISSFQSKYAGDFILSLINKNEPIDQFFYPLQSMRMYCLYNGQTCNTSDFIPFLSPSFGSCYTFNAKIKSDGSNIRSTSDNGGIGMLHLKLYVHSHPYLPYLSDDVSAGMAIIVDDNTELPRVEVRGLQLEPGRRHKLTYKHTRYDLLPFPYSDCTDKIPLAMQVIFAEYSGADYAYSQVLMLYAIYTQCGCVNPLQWTARSIVSPGTNQAVEAPLCNSTDPCYAIAMTEILNTDSLWNHFCSDCSQECSTTAFTITPSSVAAPSTVYFPFIKSFVENSNVTLPTNWSSTWKSEILHNYVSLDVVCETYRVENYTQEASVSSVDLLSNVGGQSGLWIGISFLSIMELVEMIYRFIRYHLHVVRERFIRKNRPQP
ncbi:unnamed protein product [Rotaria magnacalcarata]